MKEILKDGEWKEGKASPELLREDLRKLPSGLVTKDIDDGDKVHEDDAPHVQEDIVCSAAEKAPGEKRTVAQARKELYGRYDRPIPLTKGNVAFERMAARLNVLNGLLKLLSSKEPVPPAELAWGLKTKHLWFPDDNVLNLQLRDGNPPADQDRPKHLRGLSLAVDVRGEDRHADDMAADKLGIVAMANKKEIYKLFDMLGGLES